MVYQWKPKVTIPVDAQVVGERLEALRRECGTLTPAVVVEDARPASAPLHPAFEWDDRVAAERYREDQARYLLRSIVVVLEEAQDSRPVRAFVNIREPDEEGSAYVSVTDAMQDPELRRQILHRALGELRAFRDRYRDYEELASVFNAIEQTEIVFADAA